MHNITKLDVDLGVQNTFQTQNSKVAPTDMYEMLVAKQSPAHENSQYNIRMWYVYNFVP